jgi:hypothetical protein
VPFAPGDSAELIERGCHRRGRATLGVRFCQQREVGVSDGSDGVSEERQPGQGGSSSIDKPWLVLAGTPGGAEVGESVELQDDQQKVIASFLLSEISGYVIGAEASLEDIAAAARATASSVVGAARRRGAALPSSD